MIRKYYEVDIIYTGSSDGKEFSMFDERTKIFATVDEITEWLKEEYGLVKQRTVMYCADNIPCGYVYTFENADWSHAPVEHWQQRDWVSISKICAEEAFEEVKYEIPEANQM